MLFILEVSNSLGNLFEINQSLLNCCVVKKIAFVISRSCSAPQCGRYLRDFALLDQLLLYFYNFESTFPIPNDHFPQSFSKRNPEKCHYATLNKCDHPTLTMSSCVSFRPLMTECCSGCLSQHHRGATGPGKFFYPDLLMTTVSVALPDHGVCKVVLDEKVDIRVEAQEGRLFVKKRFRHYLSAFEGVHSVVKLLSWALFTNFRSKNGTEGGRDLREDSLEYSAPYAIYPG